MLLETRFPIWLAKDYKTAQAEAKTIVYKGATACPVLGNGFRQMRYLHHDTPPAQMRQKQALVQLRLGVIWGAVGAGMVLGLV